MSSSRPGAYSPARSAPTTLPASPKPGIYLFHGEDDYRAEQALSQIRRVIAEDPTLAELNTQTLEAKDLQPEQLVDAVAAWPAFNPYRLVVVKGLALSFEPKGGSESFARKLTKAEQERARR
ncbi:MAG: hypothetical protein HY329_03525, partial [Chloroflexi bacterium]|nr:hypothetical protein [Chloroflexota bacterium]